MIIPIFNWFFHVFLRLRYPATLPQEIAEDLGLPLPNFLSFEEFVSCLTSRSTRPKYLKRFMPRETAEATFKSAQRKERFNQNSLFSYYFHEGWLEFNLTFDDQSRLRRIYIQHKKLSTEQGVEISLAE